jgi:GT2 family glycosyltransferase
VVDDGARSEAEPLLPGITWISGERPFIFARNANAGIAAAGGDVILMNDDARLITVRGFTRMAREMTAHPRVGVCSAGVRGVIGNPNQHTRGRPAFRLEGRTLAFVCVYIPRRVYNCVGPLDTRYTGYGFDDNDYCTRVLAAGYRLAVWDGCQVDHSGDLPSSFRTRHDLTALFEHNRQLYQEKWGRPA